jgi:hypothetical protein
VDDSKAHDSLPSFLADRDVVELDLHVLSIVFLRTASLHFTFKRRRFSFVLWANDWVEEAGGGLQLKL